MIEARSGNKIAQLLGIAQAEGMVMSEISGRDLRARAPVRSADYCRVETEGDEEPRIGDAEIFGTLIGELSSQQTRRWRELDSNFQFRCVRRS